VLGLQALGAAMHHDDGLVLRGRPLRGADILLDEASVTATENVVLAAGPRRGHHHPQEWPLRAARPGDLRAAGSDGRAHRGHRQQSPPQSTA